MATFAQARTFIETIGPIAQREAASRTKWVLPSICIAQAALETGWGTSSLMTKANAFFGIKWTRGCGFKAYNSKTKEVYAGNETTITAAFRAYDSLEESVKDYYNIITNVSYYKDMVNNPDYKSSIWGIDNNGDDNATDGIFMYATDPDYQNKIITILEKYRLKEWDKFNDNKVPDKIVESHTYYPAYAGRLPLAAALNSLGIDASFEYRKKIAHKNSINNYTGTYSQNIEMLSLLKSGKLIKP